jgi:hypothetical protein
MYISLKIIMVWPELEIGPPRSPVSFRLAADKVFSLSRTPYVNISEIPRSKSGYEAMA